MRLTRIPSANPIPLRLKLLEERVNRLLAAAGAPFVPVDLNAPVQLTTTDGLWHQLLAGTAVGPGSWRVHLATSNTAGAQVRLLVDGSPAATVNVDADLLITAALPPSAAGQAVRVALEASTTTAPLTVTVLDSRCLAGGSS